MDEAHILCTNMHIIFSWLQCHMMYDILYFIVQNPRCENQIDELCREIEKTINHNIQNTLNTLEKDGDTIVDRIDHRISADK